MVEAALTFMLVLIVVSVATDERVPAAAAGPTVGFTLAAAILAGGPVTGGAVNPARALGPMIVAGIFTSAWVYMVAPAVGGILAAWLYDRFLAEADTPKS
jgi:glycerol uptake facilitator-like aquaporin